jgi:two-component system sensor histidine kinase GlrK
LRSRRSLIETQNDALAQAHRERAPPADARGGRRQRGWPCRWRWPWASGWRAPFKRWNTPSSAWAEPAGRADRHPRPGRRAARSQQLEWLRLRLTELDADKARFLRHVSHELKTPLAALREGVSLLEDGVTGPLNPASSKLRSILQQNTVALQGQIEALLRFNAAAFEARELRRERTELLPLIEEQIEAQRLQWQSHGLRVRAEGQPIAITVDRTKLGTAIANLLSNAIRFSVTGGVITLEVSGTPEAVHIDVNDAGPGIAEGDRDRIFEPFFRGERQPEHTVKGTGIGLSIVQEYIAAHGGRITLQPGGPGARFRIELPRTA